MSKIFTSWTIDGEPTPWSVEIAYNAIQAIQPIKPVSIVRGNRHMFMVLVGNSEIACSREITGEPQNQQRLCEDFRTSVIKAWAEAL